MTLSLLSLHIFYSPLYKISNVVSSPNFISVIPHSPVQICSFRLFFKFYLLRTLYTPVNGPFVLWRKIPVLVKFYLPPDYCFRTSVLIWPYKLGEGAPTSFLTPSQISLCFPTFVSFLGCSPRSWTTKTVTLNSHVDWVREDGPRCVNLTSFDFVPLNIRFV